MSGPLCPDQPLFIPIISDVSSVVLPFCNLLFCTFLSAPEVLNFELTHWGADVWSVGILLYIL